MAPTPITDQVVVLTGASSGIGAATALELAHRGARLVLAARREDALDAVSAACEELGAQALSVPTDVGDPAAVDRLGKAAILRYGRIDHWINAAGVAAYGSLTDLTPEDLGRVVQINLLGTVYGTRTALSHLRRTGSGVIVNLASARAALCPPHLSADNIAKPGVRALARSVRAELAEAGESGIAICTVLPYTVDTPLYDHAANRSGHRITAPAPVHPATRVARVIADLLQQPRDEVTVGTAARVLGWPRRLLPAGSRWSGSGESRSQPAPATDGNLFSESTDRARISGGWHGQAKMALRTSAAVGLTAGTVAVLARRAARRHHGGH